MDIFRREESNSGMVMFGIVPVEKVLAEGSAVAEHPNRSGKSGRYFSVLKWASE